MSTKKLRACLLCSFVATAAEFRREGCPNCDEMLGVRLPSSSLAPLTYTDPKLQMKGDSERVLECTTGTFDGVIAILDPERSWVVSPSPSCLPLFSFAVS